MKNIPPITETFYFALPVMSLELAKEWTNAIKKAIRTQIKQAGYTGEFKDLINAVYYRKHAILNGYEVVMQPVIYANVFDKGGKIYPTKAQMLLIPVYPDYKNMSFKDVVTVVYNQKTKKRNFVGIKPPFTGSVFSKKRENHMSYKWWAYNNELKDYMPVYLALPYINIRRVKSMSLTNSDIANVKSNFGELLYKSVESGLAKLYPNIFEEDEI